MLRKRILMALARFGGSECLSFKKVSPVLCSFRRANAWGLPTVAAGPKLPGTGCGAARRRAKGTGLERDWASGGYSAMNHAPKMHPDGCGAFVGSLALRFGFRPASPFAGERANGLPFCFMGFSHAHLRQGATRLFSC
jgi:hypothetical protein